MTHHAALSTPHHRQLLARQDLGPDAQQTDIDYHVAWLLELTPVQFQDYLDRLGL